MGGTRRPYDGPEPYIFISYARKDAEKVYPLLDALTEAGYRYWYDIDGIPSGKDWADVIAAHVSDSAAVLAFHSEASKASRNCREEVFYALGEEKTIVSVYVDGVQFEGGLKMRLAPYQALKLSDYETPEAFAARLGEDEVFAPCREPAWNKIGEIQWKLDGAGVLTIARIEDFYLEKGSIPDYQFDRVNGSTAPWMPYREKICAVVIQDDIDTIGDCAFEDCPSLTAVTIPDSVTEIGAFAFSGCHSLTAVTIPDSVTEIGEDAFSRCTSLAAVTIPDSVTEIGNGAFEDCESLTAVTIPDSVTEIGGSAFMCCTGLATVTIPDSVTEISEDAFSGCTSLTAVTIPASVTKIGWDAFYGCTSLTAVTIPDSVTEIGLFAFSGCTNLKRVEIPAGAKVDPSAFDGNTEVIRR